MPFIVSTTASRRPTPRTVMTNLPACLRVSRIAKSIGLPALRPHDALAIVYRVGSEDHHLTRPKPVRDHGSPLSGCPQAYVTTHGPPVLHRVHDIPIRPVADRGERNGRTALFATKNRHIRFLVDSEARRSRVERYVNLKLARDRIGGKRDARNVPR